MYRCKIIEKLLRKNSGKNVGKHYGKNKIFDFYAVMYIVGKVICFEGLLLFTKKDLFKIKSYKQHI